MDLNRMRQLAGMEVLNEAAPGQKTCDAHCMSFSATGDNAFLISIKDKAMLASFAKLLGLKQDKVARVGNLYLHYDGVAVGFYEDEDSAQGNADYNNEAI